jgi:hypothetical protein
MNLELAKAAGIEHFAKCIKSIRYRAIVPISCLNKYTADGDQNRASFGIVSVGERDDSWLSTIVIGQNIGLL